MFFFALLIAMLFFCHSHRRQDRERRRLAEGAGTPSENPTGRGREWQEWAEKLQRKAEEWGRHFEAQAARRNRSGPFGCPSWGGSPFDERGEEDDDSGDASSAPERASSRHGKRGRTPLTAEEKALRRARRRAAAEAGFYAHLASYLGVIALLALINLLTGHHTPSGRLNFWFLWPAFGWGIGIGAHYMAVFGSRMIKERFFDPAVERELRQERVVMQSEKQASIDELSSTIAHEIRNPIAAAKSLVQQMGEDPVSVENVEYAKVALGELDRVERRISHLLKFSKEEDYAMALVNVAAVVDSALTQMRAKLDGAKVSVARNYIAGPTVLADAEKLRQVFANVLDNAIDALEAVMEGRRIDLFIENGAGGATVRIRDNGCGIPAEKLERIFNPFFTTKEKGTGLGMAISKKIVEAHQGTINVTSKEGEGSELVITLPLPR